MAVYNNLQTVRRLTNASLTSLIDVTNLNFKSLSDANLEFLNNISYDEVANSFSVFAGTFDTVNITNTLTVFQSSVPMFTIESSGNATGKAILVEVAETKRQRFTDFPDYPAIGVPGEIVYTGVAGLDPVFGEDFIGYLQSQGWVSLTTGGGGGGGGDNGHKKVIAVDEILTIQADYQYWIYGNFTVEGIVNNSGELVIANGTLVVSPGGQVNNLGAGIIKIINLATGSSVQVVIQNFTASTGVPLTITHGLNTSDFIYSTRDGSTLVEVDVSIIDNNSISLISTGDILNGTIVIQAKI
ncbi:hypothetical protein UFOVP1247_310 [uncultured Caudovirales phage]|uniref:Uncharacterized protein n=1 Tax=uncultured Caudovirales phage TaxID=2100421 RepID=A0A6J5Q2Q0_9CAUD|nr:hypothetical protein UFOVP970_350 [uncultured Caudovirales phage]CAB4193939.1 hypothetical protein UFOVP1247_310 [uncultured Caudovirales phage]